MKYDKLDFDTMLNNLDVGAWMTNSSGEILFVNHAYLQMRQLPKEWFDFHNNTFQNNRDGVTSISPTKVVCETKQAINLVQHVMGRDGGISTNLFISGRPIFNDKGDVEYVVGYVIPIDKLNKIYLEAIQGDKQFYFTAPQLKTESDIVAESEKMKQILVIADQIADTNSTVLISGESGVGKNVLANYIHKHSNRKDKTLVEINCAALPETLLEAELFGYEPGAFTNALSQGKHGLFDEAAGGTLFLDEINSMSLNMQSKLLRAIETKSIRRIGGTKDIAVDFRLITASNANLKECIDSGAFRGDLYYRLNVVHISIPPLRERKMDIIPLCLKFINHYCKEYERVKVLSRAAYEKLINYSWPGNVRELKNITERIVIMTSREAVNIEELPDTLFDTWGISDQRVQSFKPLEHLVIINTPDKPPQINDSDFSMRSYLEQFERTLVEQTLRQTGSTYKAAQVLQVSQSTISRMKRRYRLGD